MSLQHFFLNKQIVSEALELSDGAFVLDLSDDDLRHFKVLRIKPHEFIGVIDAAGVYYECEVIDVADKVLVKNVAASRLRHFQKTPNLYLCPGITKNNKLDDVIRSCTEIGICGFYPLIFKRSVVKLDGKKAAAKLDRWKKICKSASMQSGQMVIPEMHTISSILDFCNKLDAFDLVVCFWEEADKDLTAEHLSEIKSELDQTSNIAIIIGPEGGIDQSEINQLKQNCDNLLLCGMGQSILRAETASIFACSTLKFNLTW